MVSRTIEKTPLSHASVADRRVDIATATNATAAVRLAIENGNRLMIPLFVFHHHQSLSIFRPPAPNTRLADHTSFSPAHG